MYQIDGYVFTSKEKAKEAKKEAEGVAYIKEQTDLRNPDVVLKLYNKLLDDEVFSTEVGISFLRELQEHLMLTPYIKREEIRPIPIREDSAVEREVERQHARETARRKKQEARYENDVNGTYRTRYHVAVFFCIVFAAALVGIFIITHQSGKSVTILNYENELIDRYESWEQELDAREQELDAREQELDARERELDAWEQELDAREQSWLRGSRVGCAGVGAGHPEAGAGRPGAGVGCPGAGAGCPGAGAGCAWERELDVRGSGNWIDG